MRTFIVDPFCCFVLPESEVWCVLENFVSTEWAREAKSHRYDIAAWLPANIALHGGQPVPEKPTLRLDLGDQVRNSHQPHQQTTYPPMGMGRLPGFLATLSGFLAALPLP